MNNLKIALLLLEEMENQFTNIRNPRGSHSGHPHWSKKSSKEPLGKSFIEEYFPEDEEEEKQEQKPVNVSRAFKK